MPMAPCVSQWTSHHNAKHENVMQALTIFLGRGRICSCSRHYITCIAQHTQDYRQENCPSKKFDMGSEGCSLKMLFFPFMAQGHMLPMVDMAKLFAARGVRAAIVTTPGNARLIRPSIDRANASAGRQNPIQLHLIPFPSAEAGLSEGCENVSSFTSLESNNAFFAACAMLRDPFAAAVRRLAPDCVVTDMFFPWTCGVAAELGVPRLVFHGFSLFALSVYDCLNKHKPLESLPADAESFIVPGIPHRIEMLRSQMATFNESESAIVEIANQMRETDGKNYGTLANSFYELEPDYVQHYKYVVGRKMWHVGPLSLCNNDMFAKSARGAKPSSIGQDSCVSWLESKSPGSVVYICFGSMSEFSSTQLREMALGLEASNQPFIWVVRNGGGDDWIPEGFETRVSGRGLIIKGWAPQILILNHRAVGGFVTHCGWNSSLEGISAGLPLVTWPLFAEQFFNERLIVDVLRIGVAVGVKKYAMTVEERPVLGAAEVERAVNCLMGDGEEAEGRRARARELGEAAKRAVEKGGSSYNDVGSLVEELMDMKSVASVERQSACVCDDYEEILGM